MADFLATNPNTTDGRYGTKTGFKDGTFTPKDTASFYGSAYGCVCEFVL